MKQNVLLIALATFVVSLIITLNIFLQENYKKEMAEQFNKQQLLLADSISGNMENTFEHLGDEITDLSRTLGLRGLSGAGLNEFMKGALVRVSQDMQAKLRVFGPDGRVLYTNDQTPASEDEKKTALETARLDPTVHFKADQYIKERTIRYYAPVRSGGVWKAALEIEVSLDEVNSKFLAPVRSGKKGYAWMMNGDGTLLFHPTQPGMIGKNLYEVRSDCYGCHRSFATERWILGSGQTGESSYLAPMGEDKLIAFSKVNVFGQNWIICVSTPYSEVTTSIRKSQKLQSILILTIFGATFGGAITLIVINRKRIKAEEAAKHEQELEKYAAQLEKTVGERTKELFAEKEKLHTIVDAIGAGIVLLDKKGEILWANRQFGEMAGKDIVGMNCSAVCPDCSLVHTRVNEGVETTVLDGLFDRKGRYFQVTSAPVKSDGEVIGYIRLVQDITEMKKIEERMLHSEKLASLGRLTAGIAHEIGNPLTAVFSFLQILGDMETEDFKKESLQTVIFHMKRIAEIVRQLSSLSKTPPTELRAVNLNSVIHHAIDLMKYDNRARNIVVKEYLSEIPEVTTDENQITQVLINLILNAVDAMPEGGTLSFRTNKLESNVVLSVADTGFGISREDLSRIFDPFFTTKEKGTGLGLSVSYGIMKRLGGDIEVQSQPGQGTNFDLIVPVKRSADAGQDTGSR